MKDAQLGLFEPAALGGPDGSSRASSRARGAEDSAAAPIAPHIAAEDREVAARLPRWLRFGTSSWSFPGWKGILFEGDHTGEALARAGLGALAEHPLFRTVGLDRSYYGPLRDEDLAAYGAQLVAGTERAPSLPRFRIVSKVWDEITTAVFPRHPRYGARAGARNPSFLDASRFLSEVLAPYERSPAFLEHAGPFVFELTPMPRGAMSPAELTAKLDAFMARLPSGPGAPRWAFELRNDDLFGPRWLDALRANGAAHVFTYWTAMPSLRMQLAAGRAAGAAGGSRAIGARFTVARLMLPPFTRYAAKKAEFAPFDRLAAPQPEMRDDLMDVLRAAAAADVEDAFVIVNNKAEGSAPLTIRALAEALAASLESTPSAG
jgi:uncharacterized protein YecE (DUF72 family)